MEINNAEKKSFFKTKAGGLTIAFIVIMVGFIIMVGAMLYSPITTFIIKPKG